MESLFHHSQDVTRTHERFLDSESRLLVINHLDIVVSLFPGETKRSDEGSCKWFDSLLICRVIRERMIERSGRWRTFPAGNWRSKVDKFENCNHAHEANQVFECGVEGPSSKIGDGEKIQEQGSENRTIRFGTMHRVLRNFQSVPFLHLSGFHFVRWRKQHYIARLIVKENLIEFLIWVLVWKGSAARLGIELFKSFRLERIQKYHWF
jgi:hypothetical protein